MSNPTGNQSETRMDIESDERMEEIQMQEPQMEEIAMEEPQVEEIQMEEDSAPEMQQEVPHTECSRNNRKRTASEAASGSIKRQAVINKPTSQNSQPALHLVFAESSSSSSEGSPSRESSPSDEVEPAVQQVDAPIVDQQDASIKSALASIGTSDSEPSSSDNNRMWSKNTKASEAEKAGQIPNKHRRVSKWQIKTTRDALLKHNIGTHTYPINTFLPPLRANLTLDRTDPLVAYAHYPVEPRPETCIICKQEETDQEKLLYCQGAANGFGRDVGCRSMFHAKCISEYNGDNYSCQYSSGTDCADGVFCPLHTCATCSIEKQKQLSFAGKMTECAMCYRSYHTCCLPAGSQELDVVLTMADDQFKEVSALVKMTICPCHFDQMLEANPKHLDFCKNCLRRDGQLKGSRCTTCIGFFHEDCREVEEIVDFEDTHVYEEGEQVNGQCDDCSCATTFRFDMPVIFEEKNSWNVAIARHWSAVPDESTRNQLPNFGKLGYVLMEVPNAQTTFFVRHVRKVNELREEMLIDGGVRHDGNHQGWKEMLKSCEENKAKQLPKLLKKEYKHINRCVSRMGTVVYPLASDDIDLCECEGLMRCATDSCKYRQVGSECPVICGKEGRTCHNRKVAEGCVNSKLETRTTEKKGTGVFATDDIAAGEFLMEYVGEIISEEMHDQRVALAKIDSQAGHYMMQLTPKAFLDAGRTGNYGRFVNHACEPNAKVLRVQVYYEPKIRVRKNKEGEKGTGEQKETEEAKEQEEQKKTKKQKEKKEQKKTKKTKKTKQPKKTEAQKKPKKPVERKMPKSVTRVCFSAIKPIKKGDEITFNYQMSADEGQEVIKCHCGAGEKCGGTLAGPQK